LLLFKALQPVKNTGNPGCFDYQRYCTFQGISYKVYLKPGEYGTLKIENANLFRKYLFSIRAQIVGVLKKYIPGEKEAGLAEAMLIGYKDDLDQRLVQSYSNTGVVHIIAISGLHLGLIYWLLMLLCTPLAKSNNAKWVQPVLVIAGLWLFSCIAGGSPSVLRSAVMFTCLVIGVHLNRKIAIYNSLAASAFLLLCYNPFWLWDAGFQLSYAAVLSLAIFYKPFYNLLFIKNKILDIIWKSVCVTLAAQILTVPVSVYHFHQFPNLFMVANLLAVPLSSLIIFGEIILCMVGAFPLLASGAGYLLHYAIYWLNTFIEKVGSLPYATMNDLQINLLQLICLYVFIGAMAWWLLRNRNKGALLSLTALLLFIVFRAVDVWRTKKQKKLSALQQNETLQKFHLQPSRLLHRVINSFNPGKLLVEKNFFRFGNTSFLLIDGALDLDEFYPNTFVDIIILSHNPAIKMAQINGVFSCRHIVFDASNSAWKVAKWQQECAQLGLTCFSVADRGAFVFNLY
jgi:competence protein ComEC